MQCNKRMAHRLVRQRSSVIGGMYISLAVLCHHLKQFEDSKSTFACVKGSVQNTTSSMLQVAVLLQLYLHTTVVRRCVRAVSL